MVSPKEVIITADSTCDLPPEMVKEKNIQIIPLSVLLGGREYLDGVDVTPQDIFDYAADHGDLPKTAAVPPARYSEVFEKACSDNKAVVHIALSSAISSSCQNARLAAQAFDDVYVVDSKTLCTAMGLLVLKACDMRDRGLDAKKIAEKVTKLVPKVSAGFVLSSLEYLHKGGRCSGVARLGANVLGIKPCIAVDENGALDVAKKYRGKQEAVYEQYISDTLSQANKTDKSRLVIAHSGVENKVLAFARGMAEGKGCFDEIIVANAGCTIASHCGPGTLAIFYIRK